VPIFLGIDGGGTKTLCAVGDAFRVLAIGEAAGSNVVRSGEAHARVSLHEAIRNACFTAGVSASAIAGACVGVAGAARPEVSAQVERIAAEVLSCPVRVVGDMVIALAAAFGRGPGVITIAGTGSIAYGRDFKGKTARAGGWGFAISDEGSGQWVGRIAVSRVLRLQDEGEHSALLAAILRDWPAESQEELVRAANASPPPDFSRLFPPVLAAADAGDLTARGVLSDAGTELAGLATIVLDRLFHNPAAPVPVAMVGGVFRQSALVRQVFYNEIRAAFSQVSVNPTVIEPVLGALEMARGAASGADVRSGETTQTR
jgi:N-acetylglucosamine kinase-like BadF-type ATPase